MDNIIEHKTRFYKFVEQFIKNSRMVYTQEDVKNKIEQIMTNRSNTSTKDMKIYNLFTAFKVIEFSGVNRLVKLDEEDNQVKYICAYENLFEEIDKYHKSVGHGGIHKTLKEVKKHYSNITLKFVKAYIEFCLGCQEKNTKSGSKKVVVKPIVSSGFMNRGQLDLMDFQSMPDGVYKWIMHYQDHHNKLSFLCPLTSKCAREVALRLVEIFTFIGAPYILQMDNGREFVAKFIEELKKIWTDMIIVHGKPRHPQSQGSVERANADVQRC